MTEKGIQIAVARADLAICSAWPYIRVILAGLCIGGALWMIVKGAGER